MSIHVWVRVDTLSQNQVQMLPTKIFKDIVICILKDLRYLILGVFASFTRRWWLTKMATCFVFQVAGQIIQTGTEKSVTIFEKGLSDGRTVTIFRLRGMWGIKGIQESLLPRIDADVTAELNFKTDIGFWKKRILDNDQRKSWRNELQLRISRMY